MHIIPNARRVWRKAWSVRLLTLQILVFGAAQGAFAVWPSLNEWLPPHVFLTIAMVLGVLTLAARFVLQPEVHDDD